MQPPKETVVQPIFQDAHNSTTKGSNPYLANIGVVSPIERAILDLMIDANGDKRTWSIEELNEAIPEYDLQQIRSSVDILSSWNILSKLDTTGNTYLTTTGKDVYLALLEKQKLPSQNTEQSEAALTPTEQ